MGRPDFIARLRSGQDAIIEIKIVTPNTRVRLDRAVDQLKSYAKDYRNTAENPSPLLGLVVSGALSAEHLDRLKSLGIDFVLDGPALRAAAPGLPWPDAVAGDLSEAVPGGQGRQSTEHALSSTLDEISPGKAEWVTYQRAVRNILAATWSPPLDKPLDERANETKVNRRDIIFPNYAEDGFWAFLRNHYDAHYIVIDTKNYVGNVKKDSILQIANYLSVHGVGLFGVVICRNATDRSAEVTRREQWVLHRKMIIILTDDDLKQILALSASNGETSSVIRQKIEDFRLGF